MEFQQCFQEGVGRNAAGGGLTERAPSCREGGRGESNWEVGRHQAFLAGRMAGDFRGRVVGGNPAR